MSQQEPHPSAELPDDAFNIVQGVKLPPQPKILMALNQELQQPEPSFNKINELLSKDAALSAKLLKLANSPSFSNGKKLDSIERALTRLGLMNFYTIVLNSSLKECLGNNPNSEKLWEHTQVVSSIAREIAEISKAASPEYAYMAGLFHDAAIPLILEKDENYIHVVEMDTRIGGEVSRFEAEHTQIHTDHATVGNLLARSWSLPEDVCEAILFHHTNDFDILSNGDSRALTMILTFADMLARKACMAEHNESTEDDPRTIAFICEDLNLDRDDLSELFHFAIECAQMTHV